MKSCEHSTYFAQHPLVLVPGPKIEEMIFAFLVKNSA